MSAAQTFCSGPSAPFEGAISQRITALIKTDDWVVVHRGHELYDAEDMDRLEAGFIVRAPCTCTDRINPGCYIHDPEEA